MKCSLCGYEFEEDAAQESCKGCPVSRGCNMVKCPNCGYDEPKEPRLIKALRKLFKGKRKK
jgi:rubredoxin